MSVLTHELRVTLPAGSPKRSERIMRRQLLDKAKPDNRATAFIYLGMESSTPGNHWPNNTIYTGQALIACLCPTDCNIGEFCLPFTDLDRYGSAEFGTFTARIITFAGREVRVMERTA